MKKQISKSQFKARALEYFRYVETTGEPIVVTDRGHPALEIRRVPVENEDPLGALRGSVLRYDNPTSPIGEDDWEALG